MQKNISLKLRPSEAASDTDIRNQIAEVAGIRLSTINGYNILKHSIDARFRQVYINLLLHVFVDEPWKQRSLPYFQFRDVRKASKKVIIIGAGPAGLFAALKLIESGIKPVILERGKDVRNRRRDLAILNKQGQINPESNYCFGEGGAGTYSDGKLYTRSTKRGDVNRILNLFVHFGAEEKILYESHPHIGTNKLPGIITAIRDQLVQAGAEIMFETKASDLIIQKEEIKGVKIADDSVILADAVILATGHSARDIFHLLYFKKVEIEFKPFALGVRIEHPQNLIDCIQYHCDSFQIQPGHPSAALKKNFVRSIYLPPASYSLVQQIEEKGVFSFCMCPGGIIAPSATSEGELVVNGWSPSKRNNPFANSGIVTTIEQKDTKSFRKWGPLAGMHFQKMVEQKAFKAGGGKFVAPAQRLIDFIENKISINLPSCSYTPGVCSVNLKDVLPDFVYKNLKKAFLEFGKKMKGYLTNEAIVVATESRTSSTIRIPRDPFTLQHVHVKKLYPCGEGAGYAGGIVSAAMDGERVAERIVGNIE